MAFVLMLGSGVASASGNPNAGCNQNTPPSTDIGANESGPYNANCTGAPSGNGNQTNGNHAGEPCAGCVGNADNKQPGIDTLRGQYPNGSDQNAGYECDRNNGIGKTNPAHTGCISAPTRTPELDSIALLATGLLGLGGYGALRLRARKRVSEASS